MGTDGQHPFGNMQVAQHEGELENTKMTIIDGREEQSTTNEPQENHNLVSNGKVPVEVNDRRSMSFTWLSSRCKLQYFPVATFFLIIISLFLCYFVALAHGHVEPFFPYISHTAIEGPERCIFSQLVNIGAFMLAFNVYLRYKQMMPYLLLIQASTASKCVNSWSLVIGLISAFGLTLVANFQTDEIKSVHYIGAFMTFTSGVAYCWLQTTLSIKNSRWTHLTKSQIIISIILSICYTIFFVSKVIYKVQEHRGLGTKYDSLRPVYLISTISEWLTAIFVCMFSLTFYKDFSNCNLESPIVTIISEDLATQQYHHRVRQSNTVTV